MNCTRTFKLESLLPFSVVVNKPLLLRLVPVLLPSSDQRKDPFIVVGNTTAVYCALFPSRTSAGPLINTDAGAST